MTRKRIFWIAVALPAYVLPLVVVVAPSLVRRARAERMIAAQPPPVLHRVWVVPVYQGRDPLNKPIRLDPSPRGPRQIGDRRIERRPLEGSYRLEVLGRGLKAVVPFGQTKPTPRVLVNGRPVKASISSIGIAGPAYEVSLNPGGDTTLDLSRPFSLQWEAAPGLVSEPIVVDPVPQLRTPDRWLKGPPRIVDACWASYGIDLVTIDVLIALQGDPIVEDPPWRSLGLISEYGPEDARCSVHLGEEQVSCLGPWHVSGRAWDGDRDHIVTIGLQGERPPSAHLVMRYEGQDVDEFDVDLGGVARWEETIGDIVAARSRMSRDRQWLEVFLPVVVTAIAVSVLAQAFLRPFRGDILMKAVGASVIGPPVGMTVIALQEGGGGGWIPFDIALACALGANWPWVLAHVCAGVLAGVALTRARDALGLEDRAAG